MTLTLTYAYRYGSLAYEQVQHWIDAGIPPLEIISDGDKEVQHAYNSLCFDGVSTD